MSGALEAGIWIVLILSSITDLLWGKIYNWVTFPFLFIGLFLNWNQFPIPFYNLFITTAVLIPFYLFKVFSAGDVKLLMALSVWMPRVALFKVWILSILIGAIVGIFLLARGSKRIKGLHVMPYAPALLCAFMISEILGERGLL